jgi:hypothetical protein
MYKPRAVTVGTTATLLWALVGGVTPNEHVETPAEGYFRAGSFNDPVPIVVKNQSAATVTVYIGTSAVTTSDGMALKPDESIAFSVNGTDSLYAVAGSTTKVTVLVGRQRA